MELDALKEIWKDAGEKKEQLPGNTEILDMLNKSSKSPVAKMMRNVLAEAIFMVVLFGAVAIFYFIAFKGRFSSIAWVYIITAALFVFYYCRKWKLLNEMQCAACQVKGNLKRQVRTLEKYIRFYLLAGTAVVPLVFIFLGILFYYKFPDGSLGLILPRLQDTATSVPLQNAGISMLKTTFIWITCLFLLTIFVYRGSRWFINRLYGQHILKLKQLIDQMEEE
ncbi:MAG: hypothetical protein WDO19_29815 [Bacteroidota bacterium]